MPIVRIELFEGRTAERKTQLAAAVTEALHQVDGIKPEDTVVIFSDLSPRDWFVAGKSLGGKTS